MWKKILKCFLILCGFFAMLFLPLIVEMLIREGIFGYKFPNSIFTAEQWFAFWGSYIGSIITVVVLFVTIRLNKKDMQRTLQDYEFQMAYERIKKNIEEIHNYINLNKTSGEPLDELTIIYSFKLMDKKHYGLICECETNKEFPCGAYTELIKQIFCEYMSVIDKVPKTLNNIEIADAADVYKQATKDMFKIKHKYVKKENTLYDETIKEIDRCLISGRKKVFGI
mgnify:CR=1 FL=1